MTPTSFHLCETVCFKESVCSVCSQSATTPLGSFLHNVAGEATQTAYNMNGKSICSCRSGDLNRNEWKNI